MNKSIKVISVLVLSAVLMVGTVAWGAAAKYKNIFIASADAGGAWYPIGATLADVITKSSGLVQARPKVPAVA